ncbi:NAD-dependent epimerase/dehydratase family protein [Nocardia africana]|uniref:NAD-dependent epimerase/dehydratase family protein n=1 Tax=Nocardia africana TaxID=134964 RepID=A0ABW6NCJ0_9NOCA
MSERVLVTGATGFVGSWAVAELLRRGYQVRATVRDLAKADKVRDALTPVAGSTENLDFAELDLLSDTGWSEAMDGVDSVMHVAAQMGLVGAQDPQRLIDVARGGSQRVLSAATQAGIRRVVMTSAANAASHSSYTVEDISDETLWTDPADPTLIPYRRAKTLAEKAAWEFAETTTGAPELTTVLPGAVFGPILSAGTVGSVSIIARMLGGRMPWIPHIGLEVVDVRDLVDLHIRALESSAAAGQRFLGTGEFLWMRDVARTLRTDLGADAAKVSTRPAPDFLVRLAARRNTELAELIPALGRKNRHSTAKAQQLLGWRPRQARETVADCGRSLLAHDAV